MDKHTTDELGVAAIVHGPGRSVTITALPPATSTTLGDERTKEHRSVAAPSEGDACETPAEQPMMSAVAMAVGKAAKRRIIFV
jgi:hypothetical protein